MRLAIEKLLQPITLERIGGDSIEYSSIYLQIKEARHSDQDFLPDDAWSTQKRVADWFSVAKLCEQVLIEQSKDYQIVCWFIESQLHCYGLPVLASCMQLLSLFIERFWTQSWPALDDDGLLMRSSKIQWLDNQLVQLLRVQSLFDAVPDFKLADLDRIKLSVSTSEPKQFEQINLVKQRLNNREKQDYIALIQRILTLQLEVNRTYYQHTDTLALPLFPKLNELLQELVAWLRSGLEPESEVVALAIDDQGQQYFSPAPLSISELDQSKVTSRHDALARLNRCRCYFRTYEPSSPVPYLIERAIRYAYSSPLIWLEEILGAKELQQVKDVLLGEIEKGESVKDLSLEVSPLSEVTFSSRVNRLEVIHEIQQIADFFSENEHTSPIPLLLSRAIRWSTMDSLTWLQEVLSDTKVLSQMNDLLSGKRD